MSKPKEMLNVNSGIDVFKSEKICLKVIVGKFVKLQRKIYDFTNINRRGKIKPPLSKAEKSQMIIY